MINLTSSNLLVNHDKMKILLNCIWCSDESVESWTPVSGLTGNVTSVDLLLSPKQIKLVKSFLNCNNIQYSTTILNLQRAIGNKYLHPKTKIYLFEFILDIESQQEDRRPSPKPEFKGSCATEAGINWSRYHGYSTHVRWILASHWWTQSYTHLWLVDTKLYSSLIGETKLFSSLIGWSGTWSVWSPSTRVRWCWVMLEAAPRVGDWSWWRSAATTSPRTRKQSG